MAQGSGGYGGPNFAAIEGELRNVALQFASIVSLQQQLMASVNAWRMLERELALAQAAANGTRAEFAQMEMAARNFSLVASYSASQVANSFYSLASAGLNVRESLQAATGVILLAQATMTDLGEASDIVASTMSQFSLQASEAYRVSNLFVASTNASLSTVPKLAFALRQVGPIAAQANLSLEDTVGILDKLFDAGLRGEQAGTALRNSIVRLTNPVGDGGKALQNLGVDMYDKATGKARNYLDVLKDLSKLNLSNASMAQIFGTEAMAGAAAQLKAIRDTADGSTNALQKHIREISNTDWAYRQAVVQMNTLDGAMSLAANNFNELRTIVGKGLSPVIIDLSQYFGGLVANFRNLSTEQLASIAHTILMVAQFAVLGKGFASVEPLAQNFGRGLSNIRDSWSSMQLAVSRGAGTVTERLGMATQATGYLARGFGGIASAALGLAGIAVALYGIKKAMDAVDDAKMKARVENTSKNILTNIADRPRSGITAGQREGFIDTTNIAQSYTTNLQRIDGMFQVDDKTGSGSFQRMRAVSVELDRGWAEIDNLAKQINELDRNGKAVRARYAEVATVVSDIYNMNVWNAGANGAGPAPETAVADVVRRLKGEGAASKIVNDNLNDLVALGSTVNAGNVKQRIQAYIDQRREVVKSLDIPPIYKAELLAKFAQMGDDLGKQDAAGLVIFAQQVAKSAAAGNERLATQGGDRNSAGSMSFSKSATTLLGNVFEDISERSQEQLNLTAEQLQQLIDNRKAQRQQIITAMQAAQKQSQGADALLAREAITFLTDGMDKRTSDQVVQFAQTVEGQKVLQDAIKAMRENHLSMQEFVNQIAQGIGNNRRDLRDRLTKAAAEQMGAIPLFDISKIEHDTKKIQTQQKEAMLRYAELTGGKYDLRLAREIIGDKRHAANEEDIAQLFRDFEGGDANTENQIKNWMNRNPGGLGAITKALEGYADGKASREAAVEAALTAMQGSYQGESKEAVRRLLIKYAEQFKLTQLGTRNDMAEAQKKATKTDKEGLKTDPTANFVNELLGLPSAEEMYLRNQQIAIEARYALSQYLNLPQAAISREMETSQVKFRQQIAEVQKRFRDVYTKSLAQGADGAVSDPAMQDAFSGKFIADVIKNGAGTFDGQTFTREMLKTTGGMEKYLATVERKFAGLVQGSPAATLRVEKAREQLHGMANELSALFDQYNADAQVNGLKMEDAQRVASEFMQNFRGEMLVRAFEQAAQIDGDGLDLTIDIAIRAKTTQILLDSENAVKQIREKYMAAFQNLNIPVRLNAKGEFVPVTLSDLSGPAGVSARAADPSIIAKATAAATVASVGSYKSPLSGRRSSDYGYRSDPFNGAHKFHNGVDFAAPRGSVVSAAYGGKVTYAGNKGDGYGNKVVVDMGQGETTFYAHLESIAVKIGQVVEQGVRVGTVGSTGRSTGPHLHFGGSKNGKSADPRTLGGGKRTVAGSPEAVQQGEAVVEVQERQVELTNEQISLRDKLIEEYNKEADRYRQLQRERIAFIEDEKNRTLLGIAEIIRARRAIYEATTGSVLDARSDLAKNAQAITQQRFDSSQAGFTAGAAGVNQIRESYLANEQAKMEVERIDRLKATGEAYTVQIAVAKQLGQDTTQIAHDQAEAEALINAEYDRRSDLIRQNISGMRETASLTAQALEAEANRNGNDYGNITLGLRASVVDFAGQIPTLFETARSGAQMAMQGIADVGSALFAGTETNAKQAVAGILRSMAALIAKMVIMFATLQLIRAIPGGSALLSALDFGAKATGNAKGGVGGLPLPGTGTPPIYNPNENALGGIGGLIRKFAYGGIDGGMFGYPGAPILTPGQRARGGVRNPYQAAVSIHGEGQHPEAYIPMVDRRSIPVRFDTQGNPFVPLPSGQMIPVTMGQQPRKFADGGTGGNVIEFDKARALLADKRVSSSNISGAMRTGGSTPAPASTTYAPSLTFAPVIQLSGSAKQNDADLILDTLYPALVKLMDQRDMEKMRDSQRASATANGSGF